MIDLDLQNMILNIFKEDKSRNKQNTVFSQLAMITIKSLMPSTEFVGNFVDYERFKREIDLLQFYIIDDREDYIHKIDEARYFRYKDETIYSRVLPIIVTNKDYEVVEDGVIKNIIYTSGNIETLLEGLVVSKVIFMMINKQEDIIEEAKQYIINMSQIDFLDKYKSRYRYDCLKADLNFEVSFERARVSIISLFHGVDMGKYKVVKDMLDIINGEKPQTTIGRIITNRVIEEDTMLEIDKNYENMAIYAIKLRKSRIDPEHLKIKEYVLPDVFSFEEDENFFHSLLNNSKVIKKEIKDGSLISSIQTRTGMYLFKRDPFN